MSRRLLAYAGLAALTLAAFSGALKLDFVDFDDYGYVVENPHIRAGLSWQSVSWAFTTQYLGYWAPLIWVSHALDISLFGLEPAGHHAVNVLLHGLCSALVFEWLRRWTGAGWLAFWVAAVFTVHPLQVESVAWVTERKNMLSTVFWLLALLAYGRWVRRGARGVDALTSLCMALGLMAKATLVTLPFALLLADVWPLRRVSLRPIDWAALARCAREKAPLLMLALAGAAWTWWAQAEQGAVAGVASLPAADRIANAVVSYVLYLEKLVWPVGLAALYPYPALLGLPMWAPWQVAGSGLLLLAVTAGALRAAPARPWLAFGWLWFLGTLLPLIGLVQAGDQAMADRHVYVPMIGLLAGVGTDLHMRVRDRTSLRRALGAGIALVLIALIGCTRAQVRTWRDTLSLFEHALDVTDDNWIALNNVAWLRSVCPDPEVRDPQRAVVLAEQAVRLTRRGEPQLLDTLAVAYAAAGDRERALATAGEALAIAERVLAPAEVRGFAARVADLRAGASIRSQRACPRGFD